MERQRSSSERSISSTESWELVKIVDHEWEFPVPSSPENVQSSNVCGESFSEGEIGSNSFPSNPTEFAQAEEKPSVTEAFCAAAKLRPHCLKGSHLGKAKWEQQLTAEVVNGLSFDDHAENWFENQRQFDKGCCDHQTAANQDQVSSTDLSTDGSSVETDMEDAIPPDPQVRAVQQANKKTSAWVDPVGLMTVLFCAMTVTALLSVIENFVWVGFHSSSNRTVNNDQKMAAIGSDSVELLHEFYASCKQQLDEQKIAYAASLNALSRLQSEKVEHKKTIRNLRAEVVKLKIAFRSAVNGVAGDVDEHHPVLLPSVDNVLSRGQEWDDDLWELKRAHARSEYRWRRLQDNYSTSSGTFGSKFTKWLFERAALRQKLRKLYACKQKAHRAEKYCGNGRENSDGGWPWSRQWPKIRGKTRGFNGKCEEGNDCFVVSQWENWKKKFHKFAMSDYWF